MKSKVRDELPVRQRQIQVVPTYSYETTAFIFEGPTTYIPTYNIYFMGIKYWHNKHRGEKAIGADWLGVSECTQDNVM